MSDRVFECVCVCVTMCVCVHMLASQYPFASCPMHSLILWAGVIVYGLVCCGQIFVIFFFTAFYLWGKRSIDHNICLYVKEGAVHSLKIKQLLYHTVETWWRERVMEWWTGREWRRIRREMLDKQTQITSNNLSKREREKRYDERCCGKYMNF